MKARNTLIVLIILLLVVVYLSSTALSVVGALLETPMYSYFDDLENLTVTGSWNMSDLQCNGFFKEFKDAPFIPRNILRRCFIKDTDSFIVG